MNAPGFQLDDLISPLLQERRFHDRLRQLSVVKPIDETHIELGGKRLVNFCSNDYLGLTRHPRVLAAAIAAVRDNGAGSGSAALVTGYSEVHHAAARAIAAWKQTESAVLLPSGYQANLAAVQTLSAIARQGGNVRPVRFLVDKLVHASILDAVSASGLPLRVFPHNNLSKLARLLQQSDSTIDVVITESIFSMDGDAADLAALAKLKTQHPFIFMLDEAHASGIFGPDGAGLAHALAVQSSVDISIVTLSKALGGIGAAICASRIFCSGVMNFGRAFTYTTSFPPAAAASAQAALALLHDEPQRRKRLLEISRTIRDALTAAAMELPNGDSPIICCIMGSEAAAMAASQDLLAKGLFVLPIRPPTVAPGSSRLRICLSSQHTDDELQLLVAALKQCVPSRSVTKPRLARTAKAK